MNEHSPHDVPTLFYILSLVCLIYVIYNLRRLFTIQEGKEEIRKTNFLQQFYNSLTFGVGQKKVYSKKFSYASLMHFLIGWGFIELFFATTVDFFAARGILLDYLPGFDTPWFASLNDTGGIMLTIGLFMALYRRRIIQPKLLPNTTSSSRGNFLGDEGILYILLILCIGGFITEAARLSIEKPPTAYFSYVGYSISMFMPDSFWASYERFIWWFHAITSLAFIAILPTTKMFHVIAVIFNVGLTNRNKTGIPRPMYVEKLMSSEDVDIDNIQLGANKVSSFTWKQLLDSVACTECARCSTVCPATATGKPLSPMKIITDIRQALYDKGLKNKNTQIVNGLISEEELWSCTTCGACMEECPVLIDHAPTIIDMRRHLVLSEGKPPTQATDSLEKTTQNGNPWGFPQRERVKWTEELDFEIPILADKKETDVLFWVGCAGSYDPRNQKVSQSIAKILHAAKIDFAILGNVEKCTGDSARRLGDEYLFESMATSNVDLLKNYKFNRILTGCPHCLHTIKNEYPDFNGNFEVTHHSQFISQLLKENKIQIANKNKQKVSFHDPCYLGRYNKEYDSPRQVIAQVLEYKENLLEMEKNKSDSFCCGAGGGNMWYEIQKGDRININRFEQAMDTGADTVATGCSFCMIMMDDAMKVKGQEKEMQVLDLAELVAKSL